MVALGSNSKTEIQNHDKAYYFLFHDFKNPAKDLGSRFAIVPANMRAFVLHLPLVHETLKGTSGDTNDTSASMAKFVATFFDANAENAVANRVVLLISVIPTLLFYPALKRFHQEVSQTLSTMKKILKAIEDLGSYYNKMMASENGVYFRMLNEMKLDDNQESKDVQKRLLTYYQSLSTVQKKRLDYVAFGSLTNSFKKFKKEDEKWKIVARKVPDHDSFLTATSRRVEAVFGCLKQLERTHAKLGLRRIFVLTTAMVNYLNFFEINILASTTKL
jgi:hypothetical protein